MTKDTRLSSETFEKLIARAQEIDEQGVQRIDLPRAREIARELGISEEAWETALREQHSVVTMPAAPTVNPLRPLIISSAVTAAAGLVAGYVGGATSEWVAGWDVFTGAMLLLWSLALVVRTRHRPTWANLLQLAVLWASVPLGIALGFGKFHSDPVFFAAFSWTGSAIAAVLLPKILRRFQQPTTPPIAPTT